MFDQRPVYEADQVITIYDLEGIMRGYVLQHNQTSRWNWRKRFMFSVAISVCAELLHWLGHGKPADGVKCRGGHRGS